jgi:hypothetical protein
MLDGNARLNRSRSRPSPDDLEIAELRDRQRARLVRAIVAATGGRRRTKLLVKSSIASADVRGLSLANGS